MKKMMMMGLAALLAGSFNLASAQTDSNGITESTDPARAAAVEQHARELQARDSSAPNLSRTYADRKASMHMKHSKQVKHPKSKKRPMPDAPKP